MSKEEPKKPDPITPSQPLPNIGGVFVTACLVGALLVFAFIVVLLKKHDDRADLFQWIGLMLLAASAGALVWSGVLAIASTIDPRPTTKEKTEEQTVASLDGTGTTTVVSEVTEFVKALSTAPRWIAIAVLGAGFLLLSMMLDGYRFADGGLTTTPPAVTAPDVEDSGGDATGWVVGVARLYWF